MSDSTLEKIAAREKSIQTTADQLQSTIDRLTGQLENARTELAELATARKVLLALGEAEQPVNLPDNPVYQQILTVLTDAHEPLQARTICERLDLSVEKNSAEGMRAKLTRLVRRGLARADDTGRFELANHDL